MLKTKWLSLYLLAGAMLACNLGKSPIEPTSTANPPYTPFVPTFAAGTATALIASATAGASGLSAGIGIPDAPTVIAPPPGTALPATTPSAVPTSGAALNPAMQIGISAIVNCVGRDPVALRASPTRGSAVQASIQPLTVVQVIAGPVSAEGFVWWQIQTPGGVTGWAVESADNLPILTPNQCGPR